MIRAVRAAAPAPVTLKTILETGELKDPALIARASDIALEEQADFIKTSTGKVAVNATLEAARIMLEAMKALWPKGRLQACRRHSHGRGCPVLFCPVRRDHGPGLPQEIIRTKRDGGELDPADIAAFIAGLTDGSVSEGQVAALPWPCSSRHEPHRSGGADAVHARFRRSPVLAGWIARWSTSTPPAASATMSR
jgi:hypothetical protein